MLFGCVASVGVVVIILYKWSHGVGIVVDSLVAEVLKIWSRFICVCAVAKSLLYSFDVGEEVYVVVCVVV